MSAIQLHVLFSTFFFKQGHELLIPDTVSILWGYGVLLMGWGLYVHFTLVLECC